MNRRSFCRSVASLGGVTLLPGGFTAASPAHGWQIGCYTRPWDQFELTAALDGIAEAGFQYAGIMTAKGKSWVVVTPETTHEEAVAIGVTTAQRGLKILSVYGDFKLREKHSESVQTLQRLVDHCAACQSPTLLLGGTEDPKLFSDYYQVIQDCCPYADEKKVTLTIKPHGGLNATGPQCREVIQKVGHSRFRLWYDPGNIYYYSDGKIDPAEDSKTVDGLVCGVSIKDFELPKEVLLTPGTGLVKFEKVLANLVRGGFNKGPLLIECLKRGSLKEVTEEAKKAKAFLEQVLAGLA